MLTRKSIEKKYIFPWHALIDLFPPNRLSLPIMPSNYESTICINPLIRLESSGIICFLIIGSNGWRQLFDEHFTFKPQSILRLGSRRNKSIQKEM
jgi:hypothetical protein